MMVSLTRRGLYVAFRLAQGERDALGFVVKPVRSMIFSERNDRWKRAMRIGPIYMRTYAKNRHAQG